MSRPSSSWLPLLARARGQAGLLLATLAGATVLAGLMLWQRGFFEGHVKERYSTLPVPLVPLTRALETGQEPGPDFKSRPGTERLALYDWWMQTEPPSAPAARGLVAADPSFYLERAERTLVAGSPPQCLRGIRFLELSRDARAAPRLLRAAAWYERRGRPDLATAARDAARSLDRGQRGP